MKICHTTSKRKKQLTEIEDDDDEVDVSSDDDCTVSSLSSHSDADNSSLDFADVDESDEKTVFLA